MNLAEALVQALPEMPAVVLTTRKFKFNPALVTREELNENGEPVVVVWVPDQQAMYYLPRPNYELFKLFDGQRSFVEVAESYRQLTGIQMSEEEVREFAFGSADTGLFYESSQERNITLSQKLKAERQQRIKTASRWADLSRVSFKGWDPNDYLNWLHARTHWIYTWWFTSLTLFLFAVMTYIWADRWGQIGQDTLLYYTFTKKTGLDLLEFWLLFCFIGFFHESAHALTAKHYGANIHYMGFTLIYLTPAFIVEITELWARAGRLQRLVAIISGIWVEMIFCAVATIIWSGTSGGTFVHEASYKIMMITGLIVLIVNLNPLIKLDGYYALAEIVGISELKENSTAFTMGWIKKHIFRLPIEYDYVPPRRRALYVPYSILSGCYSYVLLFAVSRFTYNVFYNFTPEWAFVPAGLLAWVIFKSRLFRFVAFMKTVYLEHRDRLWSAFNPRRHLVPTIVACVVLLLPLFPKTLSAVFVLEPVNRAEVRAKTDGFVQSVNADENAMVVAGSPVAELRNSEIEGDMDRASAELEMARGKYAQAQLLYATLAPAETELARAQRVYSDASLHAQELHPKAPLNGVVVTPRIRNTEGTYVQKGTLLMEIADTAHLRARLYVPEYEMRDVRLNTPVKLLLQSNWKPIRGTVDSISASATELPPGLGIETRYRGLKPPPLFVLDIRVTNPGDLRIGMSGEAKLWVRRESIFQKGWDSVRDFVARRAW